MMKSAMVLIATACLLLAACGEEAQPTDNDRAGQPDAIEQAESTEAPVAHSPVTEAEAATPGPAPEEPRSCEEEIGRQAATELARRCRFVSPATRPPCHPANSCQMIQAEIDRSCAMLGTELPAECKAVE